MLLQAGHKTQGPERTHDHLHWWASGTSAAQNFLRENRNLAPRLSCARKCFHGIQMGIVHIKRLTHRFPFVTISSTRHLDLNLGLLRSAPSELRYTWEATNSEPCGSSVKSSIEYIQSFVKKENCKSEYFELTVSSVQFQVCSFQQKGTDLFQKGVVQTLINLEVWKFHENSADLAWLRPKCWCCASITLPRFVGLWMCSFRKVQLRKWAWTLSTS